MHLKPQYKLSGMIHRFNFFDALKCKIWMQNVFLDFLSLFGRRLGLSSKNNLFDVKLLFWVGSRALSGRSYGLAEKI